LEKNKMLSFAKKLNLKFGKILYQKTKIKN